MNKDCEIYDSPDTIYNSSRIVDANLKTNYYFKGTIYGYKGSTAKQYAFFYDYNFEELPDVSETTTTSTTTTQQSTTTTSTTQDINYNLGDVNNDGLINAVDASSVLAYYAMTSTNQEGGYDDNQKVAADVNHDGDINAVDASNILAYYAYTSTTKEEIKTIEVFLKK